VSSRRGRAEYAAALLAEALGATAALVVAARTWQTITTPRPRPFHPDVLLISGRTLDAAPTACALVALAGTVAVLATRGWARRSVGLIVALAGVGLLWRSLADAGAVSAGRALTLVRAHHPLVSVSSAVRPDVTVSRAWPALSALAAALIVLAGLAVAARGARWSGMSARYESPNQRPEEDGAQQRARADASMWSALERGEDPTDPSAPRG
jgi:uncharacterized membrane protein (TIGR02234 family)